MIQQIQKLIKSRLRKSSVIRYGCNRAFVLQVECKGGLVSSLAFGKGKRGCIDARTGTLFYTAIARRGP